MRVISVSYFVLTRAYGSDSGNEDDYSLNDLFVFIRLFPTAPLSKLLSAYFLYSGISDDESEYEKVEQHHARGARRADGGGGHFVSGRRGGAEPLGDAGGRDDDPSLPKHQRLGARQAEMERAGHHVMHLDRGDRRRHQAHVASDLAKREGFHLHVRGGQQMIRRRERHDAPGHSIATHRGPADS